MARDVVGRAVDAVGIARLGARIDRHFEKPIDRLHISGLGLAAADLADFGYGALQSDIEPAQDKAVVGSLFELTGVATVEDVDEPTGLGETIRLREHGELDPADLQIDAADNRTLHHPSPCPNTARQKQ